MTQPTEAETATPSTLVAPPPPPVAPPSPGSRPKLDAYNQAMLEFLRDKGNKGAIVSGDKVLVYKPKAARAPSEWDQFITDSADSDSKNWVTDADLTKRFSQLDVFKMEADLEGKMVPSVRSYADIEGDKNKEIARQAKDFESRARLYEQLRQYEDENVANVTERNVASQKAFREYGLSPTYATPRRAGSNLSNILAPSLPPYVRPDYRLNQAVGLPGPEGFDDPDYNEFGMPRFALGTNTPPPYGRIPRELQPKPNPAMWPYRPRGIS